MNNETRKKALELIDEMIISFHAVCYDVSNGISSEHAYNRMDTAQIELKSLLQNEREGYNRTAIVYKMNGLYNLLRYDGEVLYTGNKQSCEFEKHKWDIRYECGWPDNENKGEG